MRRILLTAIALSLLGGVASADRWHGRRDTSWNSGGTVVTRDHGRRDWGRREYIRTEPRREYRREWRRNPVYVNNGRFVFGNGVVRTYRRPVFEHRYYDYRYRPTVVVENYDSVPGYIWIQGSWNWNGYEWTWTSGYYSPDPNYQDTSYQDSYYDQDENCDHNGYYNNY